MLVRDGDQYRAVLPLVRMSRGQSMNVVVVAAGAFIG